MVQSVVNSLQVGHFITTMHGNIGIQMAQGVIVKHQDKVDLCVLLGYAHISDILLKLPGELPYHRGAASR